ncbi:SpoIIE family protein phosphatase [Ruminococcus sp.]|uniref:SpoIIE family protein phosphatase n=1 Tax=Ruminococcus sp. TaxID=41978 RepID=UPI0025DF8432|nr:SpoIIE family protein phosphatase [Ruminococcus sp.]MCR4640047.1 SpoIIE family protein phosphatase [Ruminococcus sp.]
MMIIKKIISWKYFRTAAAFSASFAAGFFLSDAKIAGIASFADISAAGAVGLTSSAAVFTGSLVRSILSGTVGHNIVKLSALAIIVMIKMFLEPKNDPKLCGINTFVSVLASGTAVSAVIGELLYKLPFYLLYGAVAGFAAYSAALMIAGMKRRKAIDLSGTGGFACTVAYIVFISALCAVNLPALNIGVILGSAVTLGGAYYYRQTGGVICGTLTVCGAFLASRTVGMDIVILPAAGLLTGFLRRQKVQTAALGFAAINFILTALAGLSMSSFDRMIDIFGGAFAFIPLSQLFSDKWIRISGEKTPFYDIIATRMDFLSQTVKELRTESEKITRILAVGGDRKKEIEQNCERVCSMCYRKPFCWKSDKGNTYLGFSKLSELTEFAAESFPYELEDCLHKGELLDAFAKSSHEKAAARLMEMRFSESRSILHEQLKITEELVRSAGEKLDVTYSENISRSIRKKLEKFGIVPQTVIACYNSKNRLLAEIYFSADCAPESSTRVCDLAADELHLQLVCTEPVRSGNEIRMRIFEKTAYSIEVAAAASCADSSGQNGDTHTVFYDGEGTAYVLLSDGMGTGRDAAAQSRLVVELFRRLVTSGVEFGSAIKLINSLMVTKSQDESFATLDAVRIDLDECGLTVIKSGAAATLIRHRGSVLKITSPTFPIGIYESSEIFVRECDFEEGDIVIMFSDGVSESSFPFIKELLLGGDDLRHIVDEICAKSEVFNHNIHADDVTVIGVRVRRS